MLEDAHAYATHPTDLAARAPRDRLGAGSRVLRGGGQHLDPDG